MFQVYDDNKHCIVVPNLLRRVDAEVRADALNKKAGIFIFFVHEGDEDSYYSSRG